MSLPITITLLLLAWVASLVVATLFFLKRERDWRRVEQEWRDRERVLVDRLLRQAHVAPVEIEREKVIKLPDAEIQPASWVDEAMFTDDVKETLEQIYPEAARMSHTEARDRYRKEWDSIAKKLREEATPLRA